MNDVYILSLKSRSRHCMYGSRHFKVVPMVGWFVMYLGTVYRLLCKLCWGTQKRNGKQNCRRRKCKAWDLYDLTFVWPDICMTWHLYDLTFVWPDICMTWHMYDLTYVWPDICMTWHMNDLTYIWPDICMTWHMYDLTYEWPYIYMTWHMYDLTHVCTWSVSTLLSMSTNSTLLSLIFILCLKKDKVKVLRVWLEWEP
jgi:hypothetical protein